MGSLLGQLPEDLREVTIKIARMVEAEGGRAMLVGGVVRDALLGLNPKDIDIEVYHLEPDVLEEVLRKEFSVVMVGKAFGVIKLKDFPIDVSMPRRESKAGLGHKAFDVVGEPDLSFKDAAARRDFTINAILYDPLKDEVVDPYHGRVDLESKILRHTSPQFVEDPLRVLRAMQMVARYELVVDAGTMELCKSMTSEGLPKERLFDEWEKLLVKGQKPSMGMEFLKESGWIRYYPELEAMIGCEQDKTWHPEGDVWEHVKYCLDDFARDRVGEPWEDLVVGFAVLLHDVGKAVTSYEDESGRIRSPRHDAEGVPIAERFLRRVTAHQKLIDAVLPLVEAHMRPVEIFKAQASDAAIRRLIRKVPDYQRLIRVVSADMGGRPPYGKEGFEESVAWFEERINVLNLKDNAPQPLILGRHLIARGYEPSVAFKSILDACFEAQLDGKFTTLEEGLVYLERYLRDLS